LGFYNRWEGIVFSPGTYVVNLQSNPNASLTIIVK
jgi:hypothetical protein